MAKAAAVVPAIMAVLLTRSLTGRLMVGLGLGAVLAVLGMALSYFMDLPPGATIVCTFGAALAVLTPVRLGKASA